MTYQLYNIGTSSLYGPRRTEPYTVDGKPGVLPDDIVELSVVVDTPPTVGPNQRLEQKETVDLQAKELRYSWTVVDVPPTVPISVSIRQFYRALNQLGILSQIEAAVAQADADTRIDFAKAQEVRRDWPSLNTMAQAMGMTPEQVDAVFILAATF